jgi:hypothetical protein
LLMGLIDYALAFVLAGECLLAARTLQERAESSAEPRLPLARVGFWLSACALLTWYAHVFAFLIFGLLFTVEVARTRAVRERWVRVTALALAPASLLSLASVMRHLLEPSNAGRAARYSAFLPTWENAYNLWAEAIAGLTRHSGASLLLLIPFAAVLVGFRALRNDIPWFSRLAHLVLLGCGLFGPYILTAWFYVANRFAPFLWLSVFVHFQPLLPRWARALVLVSALTFSAGLGMDYLALGAEHRAFRRSIADVPDHANVLPLMLDPRGKGEHTRQLLQAWGYLVTDRSSSAPLLFAHSRSFPLVFREPPADDLGHLALERFVQHAATPEAACSNDFVAAVDCEGFFAALWRGFWEKTAPHFEYVAMFRASPKVRGLVPATFVVVHEDANLVLVRVSPAARGQRSAPGSASQP